MRRSAINFGVVFLMLAVAAGVRWADGCTTVLLQNGGEVLVAKSYDYTMGHGLVLTNARGVAKVSLPAGSASRRAVWTSRYGSVTFNQYGRELPAGGMNEAGLVVEVMWLDGTKYPPPDERPVLQDLQWIQYQLDNWATTAEVVAHVDDQRVDSTTARVHFLVCDRAAQCAAVEFLEGRTAVTTGEAMPVRTLANDPYRESAAFLARHRGFGGLLDVPTGAGSLERFVRASARAAQILTGQDRSAPGLVDDAFATLEDVSQGAGSVWNIVYDPIRQTVCFRTFEQPRIKRLDLQALDFSCAAPAKALDIQAERWGNISASLHDYTLEMNRRIVRRSLAGHYTRLPRGAEEFLARFPESFRCADP